MRYLLEITLVSPVSPGSGEGWAGMIDSDVVFDELGLPHIPARRLKGILRDMAYDVCAALAPHLEKFSPPLHERDIIELFGYPGQVESAPLHVENAYLEDYLQIREWLEWTRLDVLHLVTPGRVIATFTHLRRQTAINKNGIAEEGTLRTTRVLNRHLRFLSAIDIASEDKKHEKLLALAVQATHYLGAKRNRGLGKIGCRLLDAEQREVTAKVLQEAATILGVNENSS